MRNLSSALGRVNATVLQNWRPYLLLNIAVYGFFVLGVLYSLLDPGVHKDLASSLSGGFRIGDQARFARLTLVDRNFVLLTVAIFANNMAAAVVFIILPSLLIPFAGIVLVCGHIFIVGAALGPNLALDPLRVGVVVLEEQAYILASLSVFVLGSRFVFPKTYGALSPLKGYLAGLKSMGLISLLVPCVLFTAAVYESFVLSQIGKSTFPPLSQTRAHKYFQGNFLELPFSGARIYFDTLHVQVNDAKLVGAALEDIGYFGDSHLATVDSLFQTKIVLDQTTAKDPNVVKRLSYAVQCLDLAYRRHRFEICAIDSDSAANVNQNTSRP
jgi:hypothetical protein